MLFSILKLDESRVIIWKSSSGRVRYQPRLLTNKDVKQIHTGAWIPQPPRPIGMFVIEEEEDPKLYRSKTHAAFLSTLKDRKIRNNDYKKD